VVSAEWVKTLVYICNVRMVLYVSRVGVSPRAGAVSNRRAEVPAASRLVAIIKMP